MSAIPHTDIAPVLEALDAVGLRYRVHRLIRGSLLWAATAAVTLIAAGFVAHAAGAGAIAKFTLIATILILLGTAGAWCLFPLIRRHRPQWTARLIESRVGGLHNSLTNALSLADRDDLQTSPFTPLIYAEIRQRVATASLDEAVKHGQLLPLAYKCLGVVAACGIAAALFWGPVGQGWRQMLSPSAFVPHQGSVQIVGVRPGDTTIIKDQPLEVIFNTTPNATGDVLTATLVLDPPQDGRERIEMPTIAADAYATRLEHVDAPLRYRVEVGNAHDKTQSDWFAVKTIDQIKLQSFGLTINPPPYTKLATQTIDVKPETPSPIPVPAGSSVAITATTDSPVPSAMLQIGEGQPLAMKAASATRFEIEQKFTADTTPNATLSVLLADKSGQLLARLPDPPIAIRVTPDAAPSVAMTWPNADTTAPPGIGPTIRATLRDDYGLSHYRVLFGGDNGELKPLVDSALDGQTQFDVNAVLPADAAKAGTTIRVQVEATDNRNLSDTEGPQTTQSPAYQIRFEDPKAALKEQADAARKLRDALAAMLKTQQDLLGRTTGLKLPDKKGVSGIITGQTQLRDRMKEVADTFTFPPADAAVQPTLRLLAQGPAQEAIDLGNTLSTEPQPAQQQKLSLDVQSRQHRIVVTLQSLLAVINGTPELQAENTGKGGDLPMNKEALKQLQDALKAYEKQQQKLLDQTAALPKTPVDDFSDKDKQALKDLALAQDKLSAFMEQKLADYSKLAEQDMSNGSLVKELTELYSEVTMAKNALNAKAVEMAIPVEEAGLESAKQLDSNIEKWLSNTPDRQNWNMEDPLTKSDTPMPELPKELTDMIGELMEQQEDLAQEMQDANANWADSINKGIGWDAADGPIADMSAQGVTGNQLPNNNEMNGRSGEGRSGKSQGEFVEDHATGKGGNITPTRLDPTPFQKGQVNDTSKDPTGGATGGGKISGGGAEGLEGPTPNGPTPEMQRLAQKQAQIRNAAERLNLQYKLGRYDQFKMAQSIAMMRRVESDLNANRYSNAMRGTQIAVDDLAASQLLSAGQMNVQTDTTAALGTRTDEKIHDAMKGDLPPAWSEALKAYYQKLSTAK